MDFKKLSQAGIIFILISLVPLFAVFLIRLAVPDLIVDASLYSFCQFVACTIGIILGGLYYSD